MIISNDQMPTIQNHHKKTIFCLFCEFLLKKVTKQTQNILFFLANYEKEEYKDMNNEHYTGSNEFLFEFQYFSVLES